MGSPQVWVLIPTAQRAHVPAQLSKWTGRGYRVGVWVDFTPSQEIHQFAELKIQGPYPGVWKAWNALAHTALKLGADVCVLAGDDMDPDPSKYADEIALQYLVRFPDGDGVMQPCGDPQGNGAAQRICGSPWVGRKWIQERGPVCDLYTAFYADEELKLVAEKAGKLWMRPDLTQYHRHWSWGHQPRQDYHERNQESWVADKELFEKRKEVRG